MLRRSPAFLSGLFAALIALGSVQMAVARGADRPVGQMVICSGQGFAVVLIDADGEPTRAAHLCPDCAITAFVDPAAAPGLIVPSTARATGAARAALVRGPLSGAAHARIRAPPRPA